MNLIRVLCVDDNPLVAQSLQRRLALERDIDCIGWRSDARGLESTVEKLRPNVVLLDLDMPHRDTLEALAQLTVQSPDVRVVVLSGHVRRDLIDRAIEAGAMGYLSKNEEVATVESAVRRAATDCEPCRISPAAPTTCGCADSSRPPAGRRR